MNMGKVSFAIFALSRAVTKILFNDANLQGIGIVTVVVAFAKADVY
jgi:hypothetical protein